MKFNLHNKISAAGFIVFAAFLLMTAGVYAKPPKPEDEKLEVTGKWEVRGNVYKLYDTPLGEVYNFTISDYFDFSYKYAQDAAKGKYALHSIQFDLRKFMDRREKIRRFIVLDFKIRTFPALSTVRSPALAFALTRSDSDPAGISGYLNLNGVSRYESGDIWWPIHTTRFSPYWPPQKGWHSLWDLNIGLGYYPPFEVNLCRVIFDTYKGGAVVAGGDVSANVISTNINGKKLIMPHQEEYFSGLSVPVRTFGICLQNNEGDYKNPYRQFLEISRPEVTLTDRVEVLRELPPLEPWAEYPYAGYDDYFSQQAIKKTDNPDAVYAYAMHLLGGEDLPLGVEMLKKAAAKLHIFAMYQLGVCYYRGIGVEPDLNKSLEWLKHADEYALPDARALYGIVQMRNSKSIYLNDDARSGIWRNVQSSKRYAEKHDNWAIAELFNNTTFEHILPENAECSIRLKFWAARRLHICSYYKDNIDPKIIPPPVTTKTAPPALKNPPPEAAPSFGLKNGLPKSRNKPSSFRGDIYLPDIKFRNKYYDVRVVGFPQDRTNVLVKAWMEQAVAENFFPAILYHGRLTLKINNFNFPAIAPFRFGIQATDAADALEKVADLFAKGAKLGSRECEVEALHCRVRLGKVKKEDFTPELDIRLADYPLYHMLKYMVENPDAPGVKEFLSRKYEDARQIWRSSPTGWNNFLLGAEALYQYYNYGFDTAWYRLYYRDIKDVETAFKYLDDASKQNIPPSQYLCGRQYLEGMRSKIQLDEVMHRKIGADLLKAAEQAGYARASYLLVKQQFVTNIYSTDVKWLEQLKPALDAKDADSWLLAGDIYSRMKSSGSAPKALEAYGKAVEFGSIRAWHTLGMWYYNKPAAGKEKEQNKLKAAECWRKFVKLDREARMQDINDVYWPGIKKPPVFKLGDGDYSIRGLSDKEVRRYYETY